MKILISIGLFLISLIFYIIVSFGLSIVFLFIFESLLILISPRKRKKIPYYMPNFPETTSLGIALSILYLELFFFCKWYSLILFIVLDVIMILRNSKYYSGRGKKLFFKKLKEFFIVNIFFIIISLMTWIFSYTFKLSYNNMKNIILLNIGLIWFIAFFVLSIYFREKRNPKVYYVVLQMVGIIGFVITILIMFITEYFANLA